MAKNIFWNKVKIVCTAGPASLTGSLPEQLLESGMDIARLNFSHGDLKSHAAAFARLCAAFKKCGLPPALLQDLPGPKMRLGKLPGDAINLSKNSTVSIKAQAASQDAALLPFPSPKIIACLKKGVTVFLSDGLVRLEVEKVSDGCAVCRVLNDGTIRSGAGVNITGIQLPVEAFTQADRKYALFGQELGFDYLAVSFTSCAKDIEKARAALKAKGTVPLLIAKIERAQAMDNLREIVAASDGIMVARGDLGVELEPRLIPFAQKEIIRECRRQGRPVIVATQMLESMINDPRPTRAELTDIANAALDGADAVMLSGETAIGKYPVQAVQTLGAVLGEAEKYIPPGGPLEETGFDRKARSAALAAVAMAQETGAKAIVIPVFSGQTLACVAQLRPPCPVLALCQQGTNAGKYALLWGIRTKTCGKFSGGAASILDEAAKAAATLTGARKGDPVVAVFRLPQKPADNRTVTLFTL